MIKFSFPRLGLMTLRLALVSSLCVAASTVGAQSSDAICLLVGFPPGGGTDVIARLLAEKLSGELGKPVVVENRAGAGGQIAAQILKTSPNDGNTLFLSNDHTISIIPQVIKNPGFDPQKDFVPSLSMLRGSSASAGRKGSVGIPAPASIPEFLVRDKAPAEFNSRTSSIRHSSTVRKYEVATCPTFGQHFWHSHPPTPGAPLVCVPAVQSFVHLSP